MPPAIRVENLSKSYRIGRAAQRGSYRTLRESLMEGASSAVQRWRGRGPDNRTEEFWALKGVDFEVQPGEVVGVIGRNGAGKSTLLKILSRITEPTHGRVRLRGRVGSLLEVGTGFHPELSGRENVYLNGAILGMTRREISRNFDEIVAFAEVDRFLDTPVKRYSSGMYIRLAFAVASFLETDILLIDEVLAVGDTGFQKKCLGRMGELGREGRTIVFISHDMNAIAKLTRTAIRMENGRAVEIGETRDIVKGYLSTDNQLMSGWIRESTAGKRGDVVINAIRVRSGNGENQMQFDSNEKLYVDIEFEVERESEVQIAFRLNSNSDGMTILTSALSDPDDEPWTRFKPGRYRSSCCFPERFLSPGQYHLLVAANNPRGAQFDLIEQALLFEVTRIGSLTCFDQRLGAVAPLLDWEIAETSGMSNIATD
jgi:lipopolysaccharide transport system ATP-binding protein